MLKAAPHDREAPSENLVPACVFLVLVSREGLSDNLLTGLMTVIFAMLARRRLECRGAERQRELAGSLRG
jgi:hypothetical protein